MYCLNSDTLDVIFKYKHQLEYIKVMREIPLYKHKIKFNDVLFQMSEILRRNCLHYSIYNPRFENIYKYNEQNICPICDAKVIYKNYKRHKETQKCLSHNIWNSMLNAKFKNGSFCYR